MQGTGKAGRRRKIVNGTRKTYANSAFSAKETKTKVIGEKDLAAEETAL